MPTYGDFASLLQLGVGIGIGLSLFRAPVDIRTAKLEKVLAAEILALKGSGPTEFRASKRRALQKLRLGYAAVRQDLERYQHPFMILAALGAFANLAALVFVSLYAQQTASDYATYALIFVSSGYFLLLLLLLEVIARWHLGPLKTRLYRIQTSTEQRPLFDAD